VTRVEGCPAVACAVSRLSSALLHTLGDACAVSRLSSALLHTLSDAWATVKTSEFGDAVIAHM